MKEAKTKKEFEVLGQQHFDFKKKRFNQRILKPIVVYRKKTGEVLSVSFSNRDDELGKIDQRLYAILELDDATLPCPIQDYVVKKNNLKKKPKKQLKINKKKQLEHFLVSLKIKAEMAEKNNLKEAFKELNEQINLLEKQIKDLGV